MKEILTDMYNSDVRIEKIFHLGSQLFDEHWPDDIAEEMEGNWEEVFDALEFEMPENIEDDFWDDGVREAISYLLKNSANKQGFLVQAATPKPFFYKSDAYDLSWRTYATYWIYADSYEIACKLALEWKENYIAAEKTVWEALNG